MLYRLPETGSSEIEAADSVELEEFIGHPPPPPSETEESDSEGSVGDLSPDDQEGAGEANPGPVVVLSSVSVTCSCCSCGGSATVAALGQPDALSVLEHLLYTDKINPLCQACAADLDPLNHHDG